MSEPMKRSRIRKRAIGPFAAIERELDVLWSRLVLKKNGGFCVHCSPHKIPATDPHHIFLRKFLSTRWTLANGIPLCRECHDWAHCERVAHQWFVCSYVMSVDEYEALRLRSNTPVPSPSMVWYYEEQRKLLEGY